ncbi:MAG TPA: FAD/NAD(P)-binding protein [Candidatus Binataceae bacterium]
MTAGSETPATFHAADPMMPRFLRVRRALKETHDTVTLELDDSDAAPRFAAGQFNMLYLFGAGEAAISISGSAARPKTLIHTIRGVGSVTAPLLRVRRGDVLGVRGPYGSAWPLEEAARTGCGLLLVAGGIGLAPLRPVIYEVLRRRREFGHLIVLHGARTPADILYRKELSQWRTHPGVAIKLIVDRAAAGWSGRVGVITDLLGAVEFNPAQTIAMVCGPEVMMRFSYHELLRRGVPSQRVYMSMERNMKCAVGFCGHCQFSPVFICKDGPVFRADRIDPLLGIREL